MASAEAGLAGWQVSGGGARFISRGLMKAVDNYTGKVPGFHVEHFGCRAARADGEAVSDRLRAAGLSERQPLMADVVVVNTCSVTAEADRAARAFIRRTHRSNPEARIVVTGCYAQRAPQELAAMEGVAAVVGNSHKALAPKIVLGLASQAAGTEGFVRVQSLLTGGNVLGQAPIWVDDRFAHSFIEDTQLTPGAQTRPNLKDQRLVAKLACGQRSEAGGRLYSGRGQRAGSIGDQSGAMGARSFGVSRCKKYGEKFARWTRPPDSRTDCASPAAAQLD